jgi:hypothetical protein
LGGKAEKDDSTIRRQTSAVGQLSEILVEGQKCSARRDALSKHFIVGRSRVRLGDPKNIQTSLAERCHCRTRKVLVGEESHAGSRG